MKEKDFMNFWLNNMKIGSSIDLFDINGLKYELKIIYQGELNFNFGPDVQNLKYLLNNVVYNGDIEFHQNSVDWFRHNHHLDARYNNVTLHIVCNNNSKIRITDQKGHRIKTLIIREYLQKFSNSTNKKEKNLLPCFHLIERQINTTNNIKKIFSNMGMRNIKKK